MEQHSEHDDWVTFYVSYVPGVGQVATQKNSDGKTRSKIVRPEPTLYWSRAA